MTCFFVASIDQSCPYGPFGQMSGAAQTLPPCGGTSFASSVKGEKNMYIKVYLTEIEKNHLQEIAKMRDISLSELCYRQLNPLLKAPAHEFLTDTLEPDPVGKKRITVHLSEKEHSLLLNLSNGMPLSKYIRKSLLRQKEPIRIEVYTNDISALTVKVSKYIDRLNSFIAALAMREQLYEADYRHLIQIADDTKIALRDAATVAKKNRYSIRTSGVRILRKEIQKAVEKQMQDTRNL